MKFKKVTNKQGVSGLIPADQDTVDWLNRREGEVSLEEIKLRDGMANYFQFLKLFVSNIPDNLQRHLIGDIVADEKNLTDLIRKAIQIRVGSVTPCITYLNGNKLLVQIPKSISYEEMGAKEFQDLHRDTKRFVFENLRLVGWTEEDIKTIFKDFYGT